MRHHRYLGLALAALGSMALLIPLAAGPQDRQQEILLQQAIQKEIVDGDLDTAIKMYRRILENPGENRTVAARALLQIGKCYEKLGSLEARKAYETLLAQYSDQREIATEARRRLTGNICSFL
jgi:tetratricopeptide (TPR) repeat protein